MKEHSGMIEGGMSSVTAKEPVRVLQVVPVMDSLGGISTMLMDYYRYIDRSRVQFDFMVSRFEQNAFIEEIEALGGKIYKSRPMRPKHFVTLAREYNRFFAEHREYRIVHAHLNLLNTWPLKAAKRHGVSARISHSHNSFIPDAGARRLFKLFSRRLLNRQCTHFFACSEDAGRFQYGDDIVDGGKLAIVKNAIDAKAFNFDPSIRQKMRGELGIDGKFVVGHVGRFTYQKNHEFIVDIFSEIAKAEPRAVLLLVGGGDLRNVIEEKIAQLGIADKVIFTGAVNGAAGHLQAMDAFLFPSRFEGLGIVLIEAQCAGLKCFCSDIVPKEADISDLLERIPLSFSAKEWAQRVLSARGAASTRKGRVEEVKAAGYEIRAAAKWLEEFYLSLL